MYEIEVSSYFSAARRLPGLGPSEQLHGQTFEVTACLGAEALNSQHVIVDYHKIRRRLAEILAALDHSTLNELEAFKETAPSTEVLCRFVAEALAASLDKGVRLYWVEIRDTPETKARYRAP